MDAAGPSRSRTLMRGGFVLGFLLPVPAAMAALLFPWAERVAPLLTPGVVLLRPLSSAMADWSGAVNMLLASISNGLVLAAVAAGVGALLERRR